MCGISVILTGSALEVSPFAIDRMTQSLRHRGPDGEAAVRLAGCHLGHTRLSVIDAEGGAQPMSDPSRRFWIVFNGEIYNHCELRVDLERRGHTFRTRSDTEVLLNACIEFGESAVSRLNGQFAFAFWDAERQTLLAARDRFGEKPFFWAKSPGGHLLIASEIKAILASELIEPHIDPVSVDAYIGLFYVPPDRTIYENIHPLPPAHLAISNGRSFEISRYWQPRLSMHFADEADAVEQVQSLLSGAVKRQLVADVPVGAFLSGGLDSSTIVALMSAITSRQVRTFSVGFGDLIDELPFAREVATLYRTEHHELQMEIDVPAQLEEMMAVYDEPFGDSSNIPTYLIAQYARRQVKVVLSGDGADEIFGGYESYRPFSAASCVPGSTDPPTSMFDPWTAHTAQALCDRSTLWGPERQPPSAQAIRDRYRPGAGVRGIDRAVFFDLECYLPGDILVKLDRASMAHGLETRAPFLDVKLVELVLGLSGNLRFSSGRLKHLLRAAFSELWPVSIRSRGKQGFGAPVRAWLATPDLQELWGHSIRRDGPLCALLPGLHNVAAELRPQRKWMLLCLARWLETRTSCLANLPSAC